MMDCLSHIEINPNNPMKDILEKSFRDMISNIPKMEYKIAEKQKKVQFSQGYFYNCNSNEIYSGIYELQSCAIEGAEDLIGDIRSIFTLNDNVKNLKKSRADDYSKEYILECIRRKQKINISFIFFGFNIDPDYINSTENEIIICKKIGRYSDDNFEYIYIPKELCEIYSPTDNVYFIINECMKNISIIRKNEDSDFYTYYFIDIETDIKYKYADNGEWFSGYARVKTNINEIDVFSCYNKYYKDISNNELNHYLSAQKNFLDFLKSNEFCFDITIYKSEYSSEIIDTITCKFSFNNEFNIEICSENNTEIVFVGSIDNSGDTPYVLTYTSLYDIQSIENNFISPLKNRIWLIENGFTLPHTHFFKSMKQIRKRILECYNTTEFLSNNGSIKKKMKSDITKITKYMKIYNNYLNKHIRRNIDTCNNILCTLDIIIPPEIWKNICYFIDFKI